MKIRSPSLGKLSGTTVRITHALWEHLGQFKTKDGPSLLDLLLVGRAMKGFKHLIERIHDADGKIVFTLDRTRRWGDTYYVDWHEYRKHASACFFPLYRETGLDAAATFLSKRFPDRFKADNLTAREVRRVRANVPDVVATLAQQTKHKRLLLHSVSQELEKLRTRKVLVKRELEELDALRRKSSVAYYDDRMREFRSRLEGDYPETRGRASWQNWIYANSWLFGTQYGHPIAKERVGFDQIPDFLFPTLDGFVDILEIKKPTAEVLQPDDGHPGSYVWSRESARAIGQVVNYIDQMELNRLQLRERLSVHWKRDSGVLLPIRPRAFVLVGRWEGWPVTKREALRRLNFSLHGIEVITYSDLVQRGDRIVEMYSGQPVPPESG